MMARISGLDAARSIVRQINEQGGRYHRLDLGDGLGICVFAHSAMFGISASTTAGA